MTIKVSIGKLSLAAPVEDVVKQEANINSLRILPITLQHVAPLETLAFHHRDPFDRLLVCQCLVENLTIVSADRALDQYPIIRVW